MIKIIIADDHAIVREGLKQILSANADMKVVGEAQNGQEVLEQIGKNGFDVLLLDMSMPGLSGIDLICLTATSFPPIEQFKFLTLLGLIFICLKQFLTAADCRL